MFMLITYHVNNQSSVITENCTLFLFRCKNLNNGRKLQINYLIIGKSLVGNWDMDLDSESTGTSLEDNTENFDNPTRDTLAEGLMGLIKPTVDQLDERLRATRISQLELKQCIESLSEELKSISESQQNSVDLDIYVKKLINAKQRVTILTNILQNTHDRLTKVHTSIDKETQKRKVILEDLTSEQEPDTTS